MADGTQTGGTQHTAGVPAGSLWDDTRANVRSVLRERQQAAATGAGEVAGALRSAAQELDGRQRASAARLIGGAADGLERLAGTLRGKDFDALVGEAESYARREPALFLGAAVAAGFLAVRFLKSGTAAQGTPAPGGEAPRDEGGPLH